jgi:hypothetical protein
LAVCDQFKIRLIVHAIHMAIYSPNLPLPVTSTAAMP